MFEGRRGTVLVVLIQLGLVAATLALWEFASGRFLDPMLVSSPTAIWRQASRWLVRGVLQREALATFWIACAGILLGGGAGLLFGIAVGLSRRLAVLVEPFVNAAFALPKVALIPLFVLWFGTGDMQKLALTATTTFFFFFFSGAEGARSVPQALRDALALLGPDRRQLLFILYLPAGFTWFLAGMRTAVPYAFVAVVGAEVVASTGGLGALAKSNAAAMNASGMFAAILTLTLLGAGTSALVAWAAGRSRWRAGAAP